MRLSTREARFLVAAIETLGARQSRILHHVTATDLDSLRHRLLTEADPTDDRLGAVLDAARQAVNEHRRSAGGPVAEYRLTQLGAALADLDDRPTRPPAPTLFR